MNIESNKKCVFCGIVKGKIPAGIIARSEELIAFIAKEGGYPILATTKHYRNILDPRLPEELSAEIGRWRPKLARITAVINNTDSVTVTINNGLDAGQEVAHYHEHFINRYQDDNLIRFRRQETVSEEERNRLASVYKMHLNSINTGNAQTD